MGPNGAVPERQITVFLADASLLKDGVRALINLVPDLVDSARPPCSGPRSAWSTAWSGTR